MTSTATPASPPDSPAILPGVTPDISPVVSPNTQPPLELAYQVPRVSVAPRLWGVAMLFISGLAMIVLGGCFLIGVLLMCRPDLIFYVPPVPPNQPTQLTVAGELLVGVLYVIAFACFLTAAWLLLLAIRGVLHVIEGAHH